MSNTDLFREDEITREELLESPVNELLDYSVKSFNLIMNILSDDRINRGIRKEYIEDLLDE